ncbi:MAG: choice-of-anchor D domain-containing protein [Roseimicrobium sp.]
MTALAVPVPLSADVATKAGEKPRDRKDDKKREFDFLPEANDGTARFVAGQHVDIELVASVGSLKQVEFAIRKPPLHGTLSALRPHPRESHKAIITYTHASADAPLADSFTYACRLVGTSWSAPATIVLSGQRMEPLLQVLDAPMFGKIFLGGERSARVTIANTGAIDAAWKLEWPAPWSGPPMLEVPKGGKVTFDILFHPTRAGEFRHDLMLQPGQRASQLILYGECVPGFSVSPGSLTLTVDPASGTRLGILAVANTRPDTVSASFTLPPRLQGPAEIEVPANSRIDVRLYLTAADVAAFAGEATVQSGNDVQKVVIKASAMPASMEIVEPKNHALDFGRVALNAGATREVALTNTGGEAVTVEARTTVPFQLGSPMVSVRIAPKEVVKIKVFLTPTRTGPLRGTLDLNSSTVHAVVDLTAEAHESKVATTPAAPSLTPPMWAPPPPSRPAPVPQPQPPPAQPTDESEGSGPTKFTRSQTAIISYLAARGLPRPSSQMNPNLEPVGLVQVVAQTTNDITLAWPKPKLPPAGWVLEVASTVFNKETGILAKMWRKYPKWTPVEIGDGKIGLRMTGLKPATQYEVQVLATDREGKVSEPSLPIVAHTAEPWRIPSWVWRICIAAGLGLTAYIFHRIRRGDFEATR